MTAVPPGSPEPTNTEPPNTEPPNTEPSNTEPTNTEATPNGQPSHDPNGNAYPAGNVAQQPASPGYQQPGYEQPAYEGQYAQPVYAQQQGYQPGYQPAGYAQPTYAVARPTNVLAIIALVLSLLGISIGGVITGHISLSQIAKTGEQGRGVALAGLIIGYVGCGFWVLFWLAMIALPVFWASLFAVTAGTTGYSS